MGGGRLDKRAWPLALALGLWLGLAGEASAFHHHAQFQAPADGTLEVPGSGGLYYTGAPRDLGLRCSHCHVEAPGLIRANLTFNPSLGSGDSYAPGVEYTVQVEMTGETQGLSNCSQDPLTPNRNGMVAVFSELDTGQVAGTLTSDAFERLCGNPDGSVAGTTTVFGDCEGVVGVQNNQVTLTSWSFRWTAPSAGAGEVVLDMGVVDGDCVFDSYNDDVYETSMSLPEATARLEIDPGVSPLEPPSLWPRPDPFLQPRKRALALAPERRRLQPAERT